MDIKTVGDVAYTLTRRDAPENDLHNWYWLGADGTVLELTEAEMRNLQERETVRDDHVE